MKRILKGIVPFLLAVGILLSIGWYLFVYDREFTRDMLISQARYSESAGYSKLAAQFYDWAYDYTGKDEDVAIELASQYKADGNYTKAEYTLTNAIADGGTAELYIALCKTFVEQDKLLDAVAMLDNIADPEIKAQMDALRPAAPMPNPAPGYYNQYISVTFPEEAGKLLITLDGEYPSVEDTPYSEPFTLSGGETIIHAIRIADNGLVSPLSIVGYTVGGVIEEAKFADAAMEQALRALLNIAPEDAVMTDRLWEVKEFTVPAEAEVFSDLAYLTYLEKLTIEDRKLDSLTFLTPLMNLKELNLSGCRFPTGDLQMLATFPDLVSLNLSGCGLSTVADLAGVVKLTTLDLSSNTLRNLEPLTGMTGLRELYLQHNAITSVDKLAGLTNLTKLDLSYNSLTSVAPLGGCTRLEWLNVGNNLLKALDGFEAFTGLTHLYVDHNELFEVVVLENLTGLVELDISNNVIEYINELAALVNLEKMNCSHNELYYLPIFPKEAALNTLDASHNNIASLNPLSYLEQLTYLYVDYNDLTSLDAVADCFRLVMVNAYGNDIQNVDKLKEHNIIVNYDPT